MKILAIETSNGICSVAISKRDQVFKSFRIDENAMQAEYLLPMIEQALKQTGLHYSNLDFISSSIGPGSFTGIRIGIATARAISVATSKPSIAVTNFETLFFRACEQVSQWDHIITVLNAHRKQLYIKIFSRNNASNAQLINIEDFSKIYNTLDGQVIITGSGLKLIQDQCSAQDILLPRFPIPDARTICKVARQKALKEEFSKLSPLYIREPDAKIGPNIK